MCSFILSHPLNHFHKLLYPKISIPSSFFLQIYKNEFLDRTSIHEFGSSTSSDDHLIVKSGLQERCNSAGAGDIVWQRTSGSRGCEGSRSSSYPTPMLKAHLPGNSKGASNVNVNGIGSKDDSNTLLDYSFTVFGSDLQDDDAELL